MIVSNINLNLFKSFVTVYESKSYSGAAEISHHTSPSSVSKNIKELENQLGIKLFIPHSRGVDITEEAHELYAHVFAGLGALQNAENLAKSFAGIEKGIVRIGCSSIISNFFFSGYLMEFSKKFPKVKLDFTGNSKQGFFHSLGRRDIDLMLTFSSAINKKNPNFRTIELKRISNSFFASKEFARKHELSGSISLGKLLTLPLVLLSRSLGTMKKLEQTLGVELEPITEAPTTELTMSLVLDGMGIGYCATEYIKAHKDAIEIKIEGFDLPDTAIECSYSEEVINKPAQEFIEGLVRFCNQNIAKNILQQKMSSYKGKLESAGL